MSYSLAPGTSGLQGFGIENLTLTGSAAINATGNAKNNVLTGNSAANTLNGGLGADTLTGGLGQDIFVLTSRGSANADKITDFSSVNDTIALANALDDVGLPGAISPGILGLVFNGGNLSGNVLSSGWFFKGAGFNGNGSQLSGIFADTTTGNIFYNPTTGTSGDSLLIASLGFMAVAGLTNADFIYSA